MTAVHPIPPVCGGDARILILGSFPSVKSREKRFFYAHPQNRFWRVLAGVLGQPLPGTVGEKTELLLRNRIALWDVVASCEIAGSSDTSIRNVVPNDVASLLSRAPITRIFTNGGTATALYRRYLLPQTGREAVRLPSTSPANAAASPDALISAWRVILLPAVEQGFPPDGR